MIKGKIKDYVPTDWEVTKNRFVGFIDIMGFKDMVIKKDSEEIYKMMNRLHETIKTNVAGFGEEHQTDDNGQEQENLIVTIVTFSDSIVVYSKDDSQLCFDSFILTISPSLVQASSSFKFLAQASACARI